MTYMNEQFDYECEVFCINCKRISRTYLSYREYSVHLDPDPKVRKRHPFKYNCPFCDNIKTTTNIEFIQKHLHKGAKDFYEQCYDAGIRF